MSEQLNLLVAHSPKRQAVFRITPDEVDAAIGRSKIPLPKLQIDFCAMNDPAFGGLMDRAYGMIGWQFPRDLVTATEGPLRLIQLTGAGVEHLLPLEWLPRQVALATASGIHAAKIEEWAQMALLMLHTHIPHFATAQRHHQWSKILTPGIAGKRVLIFGTGGIGAAVAKAAKRLGLATAGVRRNPAPVRGFDRVLGLDGIGETVAEADFVVLAMPLTPATKGIMSAEMFARMRKGAGFANVGRGGLVDQDALIAALRSGHLGNAVIDVTTPEPPPADSPLWDTPRLLITPHVSCDDPETYVPSALDIFLDNIGRRLKGQKIRNRVNPRHAY